MLYSPPAYDASQRRPAPGWGWGAAPPEARSLRAPFPARAFAPPGFPVASVARSTKTAYAGAPAEEKISASRWLSVFKIGSALLASGGINSFMFGVSLPISIGLSAGIATLQSLAALKIHKEDTAFSKKLLAKTRKLMRREQDRTPSGKEWSMVPVWGGVCGLLVLGEASLNDLVRTLRKKQPLPLLERLTENRDRLAAELPKASAGWRGAFIRAQHRSVNHIHRQLKTLAEGGFTLQKHLPGPLNRLLKNVICHFKGGANRLASYATVCAVATMGGIFQTSVAATLQGLVDRRRGLKK